MELLKHKWPAVEYSVGLRAIGDGMKEPFADLPCSLPPKPILTALMPLLLPGNGSITNFSITLSTYIDCVA